MGGKRTKRTKNGKKDEKDKKGVISVPRSFARPLPDGKLKNMHTFYFNIVASDVKLKLGISFSLFLFTVLQFICYYPKYILQTY